MSNFAKGFRRARTGRLSGCDRVPERPVPRPEKRIASPPPGTKRNRFPARVAANGRCKPALRPRPGAVSHPGNRAIAVSGRQPLPAPEQETTKASFHFRAARADGIRTRPTAKTKQDIQRKHDNFFYGNQSPLRPFQHQRHRPGTQPAFYDRALGLKEISRKQADDGSFILAYLGDGETGFRLELTWLRDHAATPYELGENESHLCVRVAGDYEAVRAYHKELGCVCFENHEMGLYFINDPDDYWIEVLPLNH